MGIPFLLDHLEVTTKLFSKSSLQKFPDFFLGVNFSSRVVHEKVDIFQKEFLIVFVQKIQAELSTLKKVTQPRIGSPPEKRTLKPLLTTASC